MKVRLFALLGMLGFISCTPQQREVSISLLEPGVDFTCRAISVVDDEVVWASGSRHTVLKSVDGGEHWKQCAPEDSVTADFRSLYAWNADSAVVFGIGRPAVAWKTTDGGQSWRTVFYNDSPGIFMNSVAFKDALHGIAVGDPMDGRHYLIQTEDGGDTWHEVPAAPVGGKEGLFAASNTCIQYLPSGKIIFGTGVTGSAVYMASDKDFRWERIETGLASNDANGCDGVYTVFMADDSYGMVGGGNYRKVELADKVAAYTTDGGKTWQPVEGTPHGFISGIRSFPDAEHIYLAVGSDGCSISYDAGKSWKSLSSLLLDGVKGYHVASAAKNGKCIFVAGDRGQMAKMTAFSF